ncbi:hypothetical protein CABS01_16591 [Colletotrichum abscissum]|uniref:uncharacterized protein n=1 Tax=Colletotrichum abscissum TaxID=1671311 RepID=UPI0027D65627|nr:uncharacterized protein CABS01_16591 [Colletotrichum abscissum]KAK1519307.1 hypothetical protein CABS01_16591 [Colletotrichum abscissum]
MGLASETQRTSRCQSKLRTTAQCPYLGKHNRVPRAHFHRPGMYGLKSVQKRGPDGSTQDEGIAPAPMPSSADWVTATQASRPTLCKSNKSSCRQLARCFSSEIRSNTSTHRRADHSQQTCRLRLRKERTSPRFPLAVVEEE